MFYRITYAPAAYGFGPFTANGTVTFLSLPAGSYDFKVLAPNSATIAGVVVPGNYVNPNYISDSTKYAHRTGWRRANIFIYII